MSADHVAAGIIFAVGLGLGSWAGHDLLAGYRTNQWPAAPGFIDESRGSHSQKPALDSFHLTYHYEVAGAAYVGHMLGIGHNGLDGTRLQRAYPQGHSVAVYYDPQQPARAVLQRGMDFSRFLMAGVALLLLQLSRWMFRQARQPKT